jgi:hypothetical protein
MRYFVANGFRPSPHAPQKHSHGYSNVGFGRTGQDTRRQMARRYKEAGVPLPALGETVFLRVPGCGRISVFVHGPYEAFILIAARSQRKAYLLGNAFRAVTTCFQGQTPCNNYDAYLLEIDGGPKPDMSHRDLARAIEPPSLSGREPDIQLEMALGSGTGLDHFQLARASDIAGQAMSRPAILDALLHLEYSRILVWGFMVGSFYESHYRRDRREFSRYELERAYLENRFRYDSAFVSAFRGIECVLGKPHFKRAHIPALLVSTDRRYGTTFASGRHRSWHEVFSTRKKWWGYVDIVAYYLKLRNAVSAHGNTSPPHIVMEDQVFEIQCLLQSMLTDILIPEEDRRKTEQTDGEATSENAPDEVSEVASSVTCVPGMARS